MGQVFYLYLKVIQGHDWCWCWCLSTNRVPGSREGSNIFSLNDAPQIPKNYLEKTTTDSVTEIWNFSPMYAFSHPANKIGYTSAFSFSTVNKNQVFFYQLEVIF